MAKLKAGVSSTVITPPIGIEMGLWALRRGLSQGIHDDMYARALVLDNDHTPAAIVSLDIGSISGEMTDRVRELVAEQTQIPKGNILLNCSHTHTSPHTRRTASERAGLSAGHVAYLEAFPYYVAGAIIEAWHNLESASIGCTSAVVPGVTTNRRDPRLPVDPQLGVIRVDGENGRPLACLVNYACHGTAVGAHYLDWTADFPGYLARTIEDAVQGCTCLFLQGASGDIHPWDWYFGNKNPRFDDRYEGAERLGLAIAGPALGLFHQIETEQSAEISVVTNVIKLPSRPINWTAEEADEYLAQLEKTTEPYLGQVIPDGCPGCLSAQRFPGPYRLSAARREAQFARTAPIEVNAELTVLRINDIVLAANPGELYNELGRQIKQKSPIEKTFILSLTNDRVGYIPTREAIEAVSDLSLEEFIDPVKHRNHYGATTSNTLGPSAGEMIVAETLRLIDVVGGINV
jgi:neutral ceramidase